MIDAILLLGFITAQAILFYYAYGILEKKLGPIIIDHLT